MNKLIALAAVVLLALPAAAHGRHDDRHAGNNRGRDVVVVDVRQGNGYERMIRDGLNRGALTRNEANRLREQVRALEAMRRTALRDGRLDRGEGHRLARAEDNLERDLRRQLTDRDMRFTRYDGRSVVIVGRA